LRLAAVVLSGGVSKRFGGDKLAARVGGKAVVARVFEALRSVSGDLYLSVADVSRGRELLELVSGDVKLIVDDRSLGPSGPALAICTSILSLDSDHVLFVSGDTPWLDPEALKAFTQLCLQAGCTVGTPYWTNGMVETLVQFHVREEAQKFIPELARLRGDAMRPSDILRAAPKTLYVNTGRVTRNPLCFSNVNTPQDLTCPRPRGELSPDAPHIEIGWEPKQLFWEGARLVAQGSSADGALKFEAEASHYEGKRLLHLATHCLSDAIDALGTASIDAARLRQRLVELKSQLPIEPR